MRKNPMVGVSISVAFVIVLASFTNVVGVQTVASSNQKVIKNEIDQKEFLFQTIFDIANNQEIRNIIQNSKNNRGLGRSPLGVILSSSPILTKCYLNFAYRMVVILSRILGASKIHSIFERYKVSNQEMQKEISTVIERNEALSKKIEKLSDLPCECEKDSTTGWRYPVLCLFLGYLFVFAFILWWWGFIGSELMFIIGGIGEALNCYWI